LKSSALVPDHVPSSPLSPTLLFPAGGPKPAIETAAERAERLAREGAMRSTRANWIEQALMGEDDGAQPLVVFRPGDPIPGTRYVIEEQLGVGGMGLVYRARHVDLDRGVALKVLRYELCQNPEINRRFREEARLVSRIGHDHIVEVFDFGELADGRLFFTMELLRGPSLAREIIAAPLEPARAIGILRQVCKGLAAAHAAGVIHRDLKPANVTLVTRSNRRDFVKLVDFGIAEVMADAGVAHAVAAGTPYYLAPEAIMGWAFGVPADVYSFGCTAYEVLVGRPPFLADSVEAILHAHLEQAPVPPCQANPRVPRQLSAVIMRCLAKHADQRPASMQEVEAQLCEAQAEAQLSTSWDDLPLPEIDDERRARLLQRMPEVGSMPRRARMWPWIAGGAVALALGLGAMLLARPQEAAGARDRIEDLAIAAHEAAAQHFFVYPPPGKPHQPTAYSMVVELEEGVRDLGPSAREQAAQLREEFSATLVRLGDEYWDRDGGKPFAIDYYAAALVFDPRNPRATERASLTPGQLAVFREKVETRTFSEEELAAAEPLIALAESDPVERGEKLAELQETASPRSASTSAQLDRLAREVGAPERARRPARSTPVAVAASPAVAAAPPAEATAPTEGTAATSPAAEGAVSPPTVGASTSPQRDPTLAGDLVRRGRAAQKAGKLAEATQLFERALAHDPRSHAALIGLSDVHFHKGEHARASAFARKAVKLAPNDARYRLKLGDAYFKMFRYEEASSEYAKAEQLGDLAASERLARVERKLSGN